MNKTKIESFKVIGISVKTTNENGQALHDIPQLWATFMSEGILAKIPNKVSNDIYCMYTDYEKDHTKPYTTILGCKVSSFVDMPEEFVSKTVNESTYTTFVAKGNLADNIVYNKWMEIWNVDLPRLFTTDFEIYGEAAQNPTDAEVIIQIAIQ